MVPSLSTLLSIHSIRATTPAIQVLRSLILASDYEPANTSHIYSEYTNIPQRNATVNFISSAIKGKMA